MLSIYALLLLLEENFKRKVLAMKATDGRLGAADGQKDMTAAEIKPTDTPIKSADGSLRATDGKKYIILSTSFPY